jgi:hypothetical protein
MGDYNLVQLEDIYFTDDGLVTGLPCRIDTQGLDTLALSHTGFVVKSGNGTPYAFVLDSVAGMDLQLKPFVISSAVFEDIIDLFNTFTDASDNFDLVITGDLGTYTLTCIPTLPKPLDFPGFQENGQIQNTSINVTVVTVSRS